MTYFTRESRIGLILFSLLALPLVYIAWLFEQAGGGVSRLQPWLLPGTALLLFAFFIFYKRSRDKQKGRGSAPWILISELVLTGAGTLFFGASTIRLVRNYFGTEPFLFALGLLILFLLVLLDGIRDFRRMYPGNEVK